MSTILFTGFPGFLGSELVTRVLSRGGGEAVVCVVQRKFLDLAHARAAEIVAARGVPAERLHIVEGDITLPDLGLADAAVLQAEVTEIFHLAAVYDLSVRRDVAMRVNVEGTRNVLDFAERCPRLRRLQYVSTCYVSGRYAGEFTEADLEKGQAFNNHYEETKHLAELEVRQRMAKGLPATIYRPAIVVGDSATGVTQKYDGPYFVMQWLLRQPKLAVMPVVGHPRQTELNVVPRDFVVNAIEYLSTRPESLGKTYQLADPAPPNIHELIGILGRATHRRIVRVPLPLGVAKGALEYGPGVYRLMRIPPSAIDYFVHPTHYDTRNTEADLASSGIRVPAFASYADSLVRFMRAHPEVGASAMV